jgi:simple sugar transport system ATP-binding protein
VTTRLALSLSGVSKRFGAVVALDDASLAVHAGCIHAVLGENGAGKTTLMRIAYGLVIPDHGTITIHGTTRHLRSPRDAIDAGVGMVHQHFSNVPSMTVAENVALGGHGRFDLNYTVARVRQVANESGLTINPLARAEDLTVGAQQRLELIKALASRLRGASRPVADLREPAWDL